MLNITKGVIIRAQKAVISGTEGIGKTSLAACTPDPLFIDMEGGTAFLDVRRIEKPGTWEEFLAILNEIAATPGICKTLVIDTADWAEQLMVDYICRKYNQKSIESFSYGKGYTYLGEEFARMLSICDKIIAAGIHVVFTAHAKMRKFEQPDEVGSYDRWELKLSRQVAPLLKEWADHLLFCNYQTFVVTGENNVRKAQGGKRVIYTTHHPAWDAKTRADLPEVVDLDYRSIARIFASPEKAASDNADGVSVARENAAAATCPALQEEVRNRVNTEKSTPLDILRGKMAEAGITEAALQGFVASRRHYPAGTPISEYSEKFIAGWCLQYWERIVKTIHAAQAGLPEKNKEEM